MKASDIGPPPKTAAMITSRKSRDAATARNPRQKIGADHGGRFGRGTDVRRLHGRLSSAQQFRAILPKVPSTPLSCAPMPRRPRNPAPGRRRLLHASPMRSSPGSSSRSWCCWCSRSPSCAKSSACCAGFADNPDQVRLAVSLSRITFPTCSASQSSPSFPPCEPVNKFAPPRPLYSAEHRDDRDPMERAYFPRRPMPPLMACFSPASAASVHRLGRGQNGSCLAPQAAALEAEMREFLAPLGAAMVGAGSVESPLHRHPDRELPAVGRFDRALLRRPVSTSCPWASSASRSEPFSARNVGQDRATMKEARASRRTVPSSSACS